VTLRVVADPMTGSGATLDYDFLALHRMVETAEGTKPERFWAHAPSSVFDLRFELSAFLFIHIVGMIQ
jgi:hypothetical protein